MDDERIIDLYWRRDEQAVTETDTKYGAYCHAIALNILGLREDAEECVNDTYAHAWDAMPPQRPRRLRLWLARVTRNISLNRFARGHAQRRGGGRMSILLSELDECLPDPRGLEQIEDARELGRVINAWLATQKKQDRTAFMRRYWCGESVADIAQSIGIGANTLSKRLSRMRGSLKNYLEREGVAL